MTDIQEAPLNASAGLDAIVRRTQSRSAPESPPTLLPDELALIIEAFTLDNNTAYRSKAYLALSLFCEAYRRRDVSVSKVKDDSATQDLVKIFGPHILPRLSDTTEKSILSGMHAMTALFQVDGQTASRIFSQDGTCDSIMDTVEFSPSLPLAVTVARLLALAFGTNEGRTAATHQSKEWLRAQIRLTREPSLRAASILALVKLSKGLALGDSADSSDTRQLVDDEECATYMKQLIADHAEGDSSLLDAIEGLTYLSVNARVKEILSADVSFLEHLFALPSAGSNSAFEAITSVAYGVLTIIANICAFPPLLTEQQAQLKKLKEMTKPAHNKGSRGEDPDGLENDERVKIRVKRLVEAGVLNVFSVAISRNESPGTNLSAGRALLSIVNDKDNRGRVLQSGGAKVLRTIIKRTVPSSEKVPQSTTLVLEPIQALAKLAITSSPLQVFGPDDGAAIDSIRPLSLLLQHSSSSLLQRFEAMMALTNLASYTAELASRIAQVDGLLNRVELHLLEDHLLLRRAAMELICNLIAGSNIAFERYSAVSKLNIVVALSDVDDFPTRLAASGTLAALTSAPKNSEALANLQFERQHVLPIITQLIDPTAVVAEYRAKGEVGEESHPGLVHRGVVCVRNIYCNLTEEKSRRRCVQEAKAVGLYKALTNVSNMSKDMAILQAATEALKVMERLSQSDE